MWSQGGFGAWQAAGLPVKAAIDYETSALEALTDEAEMLATNVKRAVKYLTYGPSMMCAAVHDALSCRTSVWSLDMFEASCEGCCSCSALAA